MFIFELTEKRRNQRGFTLVETLIYVSFLAAFSSLVITSLLLVTKNFYVLRLERELRQSGTVASERILRETRNAYELDIANSDLHVAQGRIILRKKDLNRNNTTVEFYIDANSQISLREGGVDKGVLLGKNVRVESFVINYFSEIPYSPMITANITLEIASIFGGPPRTFSFQTSGVLRGGSYGPY